MTKTETNPLIEDYLKRLDKALAPLPRARRGQLVAEIADHVETARSELESHSEADLRNLLDRIGRPEDIAAEALGSGVDESIPRRDGLHENVAIALLLVGGFILSVGWFVGLVLLWTSSVWRLRDKLIGTFLLPGGLLPAVFIFIANSSTSTSNGLGTTVCSGARTIHVNGHVRYVPIPGHYIQSCTTAASSSFDPSALSLFLVALTFIIPILTAVYLHRRRRVLQTASG